MKLGHSATKEKRMINDGGVFIRIPDSQKTEKNCVTGATRVDSRIIDYNENFTDHYIEACFCCIPLLFD